MIRYEDKIIYEPAYQGGHRRDKGDRDPMDTAALSGLNADKEQRPKNLESMKLLMKIVLISIVI